jgi:hypothetical protein
MAAFVTPSLAAAADKADKAPPVTKEQKAKGMAALPALLTAAGSDCKLSDGRFLGETVDPKTKKKTALYEAACDGSEGLLVEQIAAETPLTFTCVEAAEPGPDGKKRGNQCVLPANLDPKAGLTGFIAAAKVTCTPDKVRALGHSPTNVFVELACHEGGGFILEFSNPPRLDKPASANPCIMFDPSNNVHCVLTDRAAQLAIIDKMVAASGKPCVIKDRGFIGVTQSGATYYEVACADGKGWVVQQAADGSFAKIIDCAFADSIAGGCKLTDTRQAKTEQSGLYTTLSKRAGFNCEVSGYAPLPVDVPGKEVVELTCSNRPDGAIGIFAASSSQPSEIIDCAHAELRSYRCALSKPAAAVGSLTAELRALGKMECTVSNSRVVGVTTDKHGYIEVACSDGLPGYMIEYAMDPMKATSTITCFEAKGIAGGCTLPGNVKKS